MSEGILFRFANEEMIYLLRSLQITAFPGMAPEPLKRLPDTEKSLLMMEADHTLRARGLVHWRGETKREIDPLITKLLLDCAQPTYMLFVDLLDAFTGTANLLYIFSPEATVEQSEPEPQVQQYLVIPSREDFARRLRTLLLPQQAEASSEKLPEGQVNLALWQEASKMARANEAAAGSLLARNLPGSTAKALAHALHTFQRICYVAHWKQIPAHKGDSPEAALTTVVGEKGLFLLWQKEPTSSRLTVLPASEDLVGEYVIRLLIREH